MNELAITSPTTNNPAPVVAAPVLAQGAQFQPEPSKTQTKEWAVSILPPELASDLSISKYNSVTDFAKGHVELSKELGKPKVNLPQAAWTGKEYGELWDKLGRPESADKYALELPAQLPPGVFHDQELEKWYKDTAHEVGLTQLQAGQFYKRYFERVAGQAAAQQAQIKAYQEAEEKEAAKLPAEYGNDWTVVKDGVSKIVHGWGGPEMTKLVSEKGLTNNATMFRFIAKIFQKVRPHNVFSSDLGLANSQGLSDSPAEADAKLTKLKADPNWSRALNDISHKDHFKVLDEYKKLLAAKNRKD